MKNKKIIVVGLSGALFLTSATSIDLLNNKNIVLATNEVDINNLDVKNLPDGEYTVNFEMLNAADNSRKSMSNNAVIKPAKLFVKNGEYKVELNFIPITMFGSRGYLGNLKYYENGVDGEKIQTEIKEFYSENEKDGYFKVYQENFPDRTKYPKIIAYPVKKEAISENKKLKTKVEVFVPVMEALSKGSGPQPANPVFDFSTLKVVKLDSTNNTVAPTEKETIKPVVLNIQDKDTLKKQVRRAIDKNAKLIIRDGKKYLLVRYYSKQNWGGDYIYDNGLRELAYNYSDSEDNVINLNSNIVEEGEHYQISEVEIPVDNNENIYLHAKVQVNANLGTEKLTNGLITFKDGKDIEKSSTLERPNLLRTSQLGSFIKDDSKPRLEFDYEKNGELYSPYTAEAGTKFKLADSRLAVEMNFERKSTLESDVRYLKYTLDGTEPTMESKSAEFRSQTADESIDMNLYRVYVNPMVDINGFSKNGGDVTVKVKGFNKDGTKSSETATYTLPFSKYMIDSVNFNLNIKENNYQATLKSNGKYALTEDATLNVEDPEEEINTIIQDVVKKSELENATIKKISLVDKNNNPYPINYNDGWNEELNPLLKLDIKNYSDNNALFYQYIDGNLKLIPTNSKSKQLSVDINHQSGYYILATGDVDKVLKEKIALLEQKKEEAQELASNSPETAEKLKLDAELEQVKKSLSRKKFLKLDKVITHLDNLEYYSKKTLQAKENENHIKEKAKEYINIIKSNIYEKVLKEEKLNKIKKLGNQIESNLENIKQLKQLTKTLEKELETLEYKYDVKNIEYSIEKSDKPGIPSMANPVFEGNDETKVKFGKLILAPNKTYLLVSLKPMVYVSIRAHLTDLDVLVKDSEEEYPVYAFEKYGDIDSHGNLKLYDKKLIIELDKKVLDNYVVKLGNDGMNGAKPKARLVIKTNLSGIENRELNKKPLQNEINKENEVKESVKYKNSTTEDKKQNYENALTKAKDVLNKEDATQEELDKAKQSIIEAYEALDGKERVQIQPQPIDNNNVNNIPNSNENKGIENKISDDINKDKKVILENKVNDKLITVEFSDINAKDYTLDVKDITKEKTELVKEKLNNKNINVVVLDLKLLKKSTLDEVNLNAERTVKVAITEDTTNKDVKVYYINEKTGELELLPSSIENNVVLFKTNHFSKYAVVLSDHKNNSKTIKNKKINKLPLTGEYNNTNLLLLTTILSAVAVLFTRRRKNK